MTSHGWSPILKQAIALASVAPQYEGLGTSVAVEWTVEGRRGRVAATVVELPFLDLARKRAGRAGDSVARPVGRPSRTAKRASRLRGRCNDRDEVMPRR